MADPMSVAYDAGLEFGQRLCVEVRRERDRLREILEETDTDLFKTMDCLRAIESERDKLRQALEGVDRYHIAALDVAIRELERGWLTAEAKELKALRDIVFRLLDARADDDRRIR